MSNPIITAARLRELLHYDPLTGIFTRRVGTPGHSVGSVAGTPKKEDGRNKIMIDKRRYVAARLAWLYMTGEWPKFEVDHEDTDPKNDRWKNLRDIQHLHNMQNMRRAPSSKKHSKLLGAIKVSDTRWAARIRVGGKTKHLGYFGSDIEASEAYRAAKRLLHEGCTL